MIYKIKEALEQTSLKQKQIDEVVAALQPLFTLKSAYKRPEDKEVNGVLYRFCSMAKDYFPADMFVPNKNYTREANRIWVHHNNTGSRLENEAAMRYINGDVDRDEYDQLVQEAKAYSARKSDPATYADIPNRLAN